MYACWEWGCLRVLRAWGRLGLIRLPPYGSRHLYDRTLTHPPTVLPASHGTPDRAPLGGSGTRKGGTRHPESGTSGGTGKLEEASAIRA